MQFFKRFTPIALAAALLVSMTGCGGNTAQTEEEDEYEVVVSEYEVVEDVPGGGGETASRTGGGGTGTASGGTGSTGGSTGGSGGTLTVPKELRGTTVKYATWIDDTKTEAGPVIAGFEKETGIKVQLVTVPQHTYLTKLAAMVTSGQAPDVYQDNEEWPHLFSIAAPVENAGINVNDPIWDQTVIKYGTVNGKHYLVNTVGSLWQEKDLVYYNKKIFANSGITTPTEYEKANNWTWDTFYKCLSDVKAAGYIGGFINPNLLANSVGGGFLKYDINAGKFTSNVDNPNFAAAWQFYLRALKAGIIDQDPPDAFRAGRCGLYMQGTYGLKKTGYWGVMDPDDLGFAHYPKMKASDAKYPNGSFLLAYGLCKNAKNPKAAGYFLQYYLDPESYKKNGSYHSAFLNEEAEKFYFELNSQPFDNIMVENGPGNLMREGAQFYYFQNLMLNACKKDPSQVQTGVATIRNQVQDAAKTANDTLAKLR